MNQSEILLIVAATCRRMNITMTEAEMQEAAQQVWENTLREVARRRSGPSLLDLCEKFGELPEVSGKLPK